MAARRLPTRVWRILLDVTLLAAILVASSAEDSADPSSDSEPMVSEVHAAEKKYIAALAKNGRLPKFAAAQKRFEKSGGNIDDTEKDETLDDIAGDWMEEKRHIGAFLKAHGRPGSSSIKDTRRAYENEDDNSRLESSEIVSSDKRNVASLARLGRLNAVRFGGFQPSSFGGKKRITVYEEEQNDGVSTNEISKIRNECEDDDENESENTEDNFTHPNWMQSQKKRYIAALARSGRLPVWHSQRMWSGGKRDIPRAYWLRYRSGARTYGGKRQNTEYKPRIIQEVTKKCKKGMNGMKTEGGEEKSDTNEKRNLAMLARKGKLPYRA